MSVNKLIISLFIILSLVGQNTNAQENVSCLSEVLENPRSAQMYADFYYEYEDEDKSAFAQRFFAQVQLKMNSENGCAINTKQPSFTCVEGNGSYPVCGAKVDDFYIAVVKDYVDSARLVVNQRPSNGYTWVPGVKKQNDDTTLYLPDTSYCYSELLDDSYDSQVYALDMTPYLPRNVFAGDRRFVIAQSLRDVVREKAEEFPRCELKITEYPTSNVVCKAMKGNAWQACFVSPRAGGGYFVYTFLHGSPLMHMTFNRWD